MKQAGWEARRYVPSGAEHIVQNVPVDLQLLGVSEDGRALVGRVNWRVGINCLVPG